MTKNTTMITRGSVMIRILGSSDPTIAKSVLTNSVTNGSTVVTKHRIPNNRSHSYKRREHRLRKKQAECIHPYAKLTVAPSSVTTLPPPGFEASMPSSADVAACLLSNHRSLAFSNTFSPPELYSQMVCESNGLTSTSVNSPPAIYELSDFERSQIVDLLSSEMRYHPNTNFLYYVNPVVEDKVDATLRNEAIFNLRFLHNGFFTLSSDTFAKAVNLMDRFIVKVKVKPKYTACVATACYYIAARVNEPRENCPTLETLVQISRCGGTAADLERMRSIIESKLAGDVNGVTALDFVRAFRSSNTTQSSAKQKHKQLLTHGPTLNQSLTTRLLIGLCSLEVYRYRPACLALAILLQEGGLKNNLPLSKLEALAAFCEIPWTEVEECSDLVQDLYDAYYRHPLPCSRGQLVWTLSRRTLSRMVSSSPTPLDTISEDAESTDEEELWLESLFE